MRGSRSNWLGRRRALRQTPLTAAGVEPRFEAPEITGRGGSSRTARRGCRKSLTRGSRSCCLSSKSRRRRRLRSAHPQRPTSSHRPPSRGKKRRTSKPPSRFPKAWRCRSTASSRGGLSASRTTRRTRGRSTQRSTGGFGGGGGVGGGGGGGARLKATAEDKHSFQPYWDGEDVFSDAQLARLLHSQDGPFGAAGGGSSALRSGASSSPSSRPLSAPPLSQATAVARALQENMQDGRRLRAASASSSSSSPQSLASLSSHSQNVHSSLVEEPALKTMDDLEARLPPGTDEGALLRDLAIDIQQRREGLPEDVANSALRALKDEAGMKVEFEHGGRRRRFGRCVAVVYSLVEVNRSRWDLVRRMAEEISEGVGTCAGGRVGRVFNAVRGFISIDFQVVEEHGRVPLSDAVTPILRSKDNIEVKKRNMMRLLDEYGVVAQEERQPWIDALEAEDL